MLFEFVFFYPFVLTRDDRCDMLIAKERIIDGIPLCTAGEALF